MGLPEFCAKAEDHYPFGGGRSAAKLDGEKPAVLAVLRRYPRGQAHAARLAGAATSDLKSSNFPLRLRSSVSW